jgi:lipoyl-dependent peroxiredoxin
MIIKRNGRAEWTGNLKSGKGCLYTESGIIKGNNYSFLTRFEEGGGTNPEELISAAHAACYSMDLAHKLSQNGYIVESITTSDTIHLKEEDGDYYISKIIMQCEAKVEGIDKETLLKFAEDSKKTCIVSRALKGIEMELEIIG